jgi:hypothetical protein
MADTDHDLFLCALYHKTFVATENGTELRTDNEPERVTPGGAAIPLATQHFTSRFDGPDDVVIGQSEPLTPVTELPTAISLEEKS